MRHLDLFSGIGGFALATEMVWPDAQHVFCEIDPFCREVLRKHWPNSEIHENIRNLTGGGTIDLVTGGFPCQPFSASGKRAGTQDDRHLWPEMLRVIREVHPRWIVGENVDGLITWNRGMVLETILNDLASAQYETQCFVIPAAAVAAPHRRDRIWIVGHADGVGSQTWKREEHRRPQEKRLSHPEEMADTDCINVQGSDAQESEERQNQGRPAGLRGGEDRRFAKWPAEPYVGRVAHGIPNRVDRIKSLGNAIVPQVAAEIMRAIKTADDAYGN